MSLRYVLITPARNEAAFISYIRWSQAWMLLALSELCGLERAKRVGERKVFSAVSLTEYTEHAEKDQLDSPLCDLCALE
jgi:hypothetical protein